RHMVGFERCTSGRAVSIVGEMMARQCPAQERSGERSGQDDGERDQGYCDGTQWFSSARSRELWRPPFWTVTRRNPDHQCAGALLRVTLLSLPVVARGLLELLDVRLIFPGVSSNYHPYRSP